MAEIGLIGDLAHELEGLYEGLVDRRYSYSTELSQVLMASHERLALQLDQLQDQQPLSDSSDLIAQLRELRHSSTPAAAATAPEVATADPELLEIFLEEAADILDSSGSALVRWQAEPNNRQEVETLLRDLHTLKGGARMVEIGPIGDLAHELEFLYEGLSAGLLAPSPELFSLLQGCHDRLAQMIDAVADGLPVGSVDKLIERIKSLVHPSDEPLAPVALPAGKAEAAMDPAADMVKISADLLDDLVNLAGETSIFRGASSSRSTMRARPSARSKPLSSACATNCAASTAKPRVVSSAASKPRPSAWVMKSLTRWKWTAIRSCSNCPVRCPSPLPTCWTSRETLDRRNQDAHNLLQQQARINTELQEGLMRTRMVPFERMLPRLKRIVRQVAEELGKDVEFVVGNAEGEMDRNVLERMVAPLEHMLRNAVDHGLESREARVLAGKPEKGRITLDLTHEGGDIVFDMRDDGAGVPLDAVRRKAIKRGLLDPIKRSATATCCSLSCSRVFRRRKRSPRYPDAAWAWTWCTKKCASLAARW